MPITHGSDKYYYCTDEESLTCSHKRQWWNHHSIANNLTLGPTLLMAVMILEFREKENETKLDISLIHLAILSIKFMGNGYMGSLGWPNPR